MSYAHPSLMPPFSRPPSRVAIVRAERYDQDLTGILFQAIKGYSSIFQGTSVLLKPNFVEPDPGGIINTHPAVVAAAREAFLRLGAKSVRIAEGPGHERDSEAILETLRLRDYLGPLQDIFVDLNLDEVRAVDLRTRASKLKQLYFPRTVLESEFVVSMPKLKTHHWVGATLSMKNLFGTVPSGVYGWPKNVLHWAGIDESIADLYSTYPGTFAIVDGIVGMEGNGPIQGKPKDVGVVVAGRDMLAVDATCCRIMHIDPLKVGYLRMAARGEEQLSEAAIRQTGEAIRSVASRFDLLPQFQDLRLESA